MLAMTYRGPYRVRLVDKPMPELEHPRDAIVRVTRACICGSDLHLYHGLVPDTRVGHTFGHEFCGIVEEVGPQVENLKHGDRALVPFNIFCGECFFCKKGDTVIVFGAGPVGLFAAKSAWILGAGRVIIVDEYEYRLEFAKKFAQCETVNFSETEDPVWLLKKMTDWAGADVCIDAVGCEARGSVLQRLSGMTLKLQAGAATPSTKGSRCG